SSNSSGGWRFRPCWTSRPRRHHRCRPFARWSATSRRAWKRRPPPATAYRRSRTHPTTRVDVAENCGTLERSAAPGARRGASEALSSSPHRSRAPERCCDGSSRMFEPNQRVKVNLSGLTIKGVAFSQNVQEALGTIVQRIAAEPPTYLVELIFSFKGIK